MHSPKLLVLVSTALALIFCAPQILLAQYAITTVAGGGPNNLAVLNASIGFPGSVVLDTAGNAYIADSYSSHFFLRAGSRAAAQSVDGQLQLWPFVG